MQINGHVYIYFVELRTCFKVVLQAKHLQMHAAVGTLRVLIQVFSVKKKKQLASFTD